MPAKKTAKKKAAAKRSRKAVKVQILDPEEATAMNWQDARNTLAAVKLHARLFLAGQVILGMQLQAIKKALGFKNGGDRRSECQRGTLIQTWEDHLKAELGITKRTAYRFERLAEAARTKMKKLGGQKHALALLNTSPADLDEENRKVLETLVHKITDGQTQKSLLEDLTLVKTHTKGNGGHNPGDDNDEEESAEQLAFAFFRPFVSQLAEMRINKTFDHSLAALPTHGDEETQSPGLLDLKNHLQATLHEVEQTLKSKKKSKKK